MNKKVVVMVNDFGVEVNKRVMEMVDRLEIVVMRVDGLG